MRSDKYTTALLKNNTAANQYTLLTLLVKTAVIGNFTGNGTKLPMLPGSLVNVPGILAKGNVNGTEVNLAPYFTGALLSSNVNDKPASVNWLDLNATMLTTNATYIGPAGSNANTLLSHLFSYFGAALGCTTYGQTGFPAYAGDKSMTDVHKFMAINSAMNTWFVMQVGLAAQSFGATQEDISAVGMLLLNTFNRRCAAPATVIPAQGAQLQAICLDSSCPLAANATCSAYPSNVFTAAAQISTSPATSSSSPGATTTTAGTSGTARPNSSTSAATTPTGGAVAKGVSGALAVMAGAAAFVL